MRILKLPSSLLWMILLAAVVLPSAKASDFDQKTIVTFSQPVEIPGRILPPGTYVFKLLDIIGQRNIVQIFDEKGTHLYGTMFAISESRPHPTDTPETQLKERTAGGPLAIQTWFYPGLVDGERFTYLKAPAQEVGTQIKQPVPYMPSELPPTLAEPKEPMDRPKDVALEGAGSQAMTPKE